jgi:hypothetical protein
MGQVNAKLVLVAGEAWQADRGVERRADVGAARRVQVEATGAAGAVAGEHAQELVVGQRRRPDRRAGLVELADRAAADERLLGGKRYGEDAERGDLFAIR